jgi:tyrosine-protein phosphatase SIW14
MGLKNSSRSRVAVVLFALSIAAPSAAQTTITSPLKAAGAALSRIHIENFGQVNASYYRGALPKGNDFTDLAALGVKTLIDLTNGDGQTTEQSLAEQAGMKFFRIPMDTHVVPTAKEMTSFLKIVTDRANQPVYVHCVGGRHRTGVMTAIYRMTQDRWTPDQAFKEMKKFKFGADFMHPEFKKFVYDFKDVAIAAAAAGSNN